MDKKNPPFPGSGGFFLTACGSNHHVQVIRPFADEAQVFGVSVWVAAAVQPAGGPATAVAVTVTFCEGVKPWPEPLPEK